MNDVFNNRLRQILLLLLIILLALILFKEIYIFVPGFLGALTLYILQRQYFFYLTFKKKWNKALAASIFLLASLILIAIPIYFSIQLISNKVSEILNNTSDIVEKAKIIQAKVQASYGINLFNEQNILEFEKQAKAFIPMVLNNSANILSNFAIMFFLQYFLLVNGREVEKFLNGFIPLKEENVTMLARETKNMIKSNAIGIPILAVIQGIVATTGYWFFKVDDFILWGFLTGVCSIIPVIGTAIIWIPLTAYFFAIDNTGGGIGLLLFSVIILTNIDNVARLTILKKLIDVHPLITIFGVIIGISLFGFWGVIFGPLLISYFIILLKIYSNEFGKATI